MPAVHERPLGGALTEIRNDVWVLRAGAIAEAGGSVTLLLAVDGLNLETIVPGLDAAPGYMSTRFVGIDATGLVIPIHDPQAEHAPPSSKRPNPPATLRAGHLVVISRAVAAEAQASPLGLEDILRALVSASVGLGNMSRPLGRIAEVVSECHVAHLGVASTVTVDELMSMARGRVSETGLVVDESPLSSKARHRSEHEPAEGSTPARPLYFRGPALDEIELSDGSSAVLQGAVTTPLLHVLSAGVARAWNGADGVERTRLGGPDSVVNTLRELGLLDSLPSWRIADDVAWVGDDARTTVLSPDGVSPLALAGSSHVVWSILVDLRAVRQDVLVDSCARVFEADAREIEGPIEALLYDLWTRGLLVRI
ncbi:hypothetical protein [Microbacterium sp. J1-1]|uniref:hypothetical protein n=1 Tax=Microbacterium sp. J1-1 TaxID=2992441 RepID=UPI0021153323|nr:hypothetical protein [Microbacterium sp. J1-1]UUE21483.1 hypothetical protein LRQ07_04210 [Microbacterium sp. J1-1]